MNNYYLKLNFERHFIKTWIDAINDGSENDKSHYLRDLDTYMLL